MLPTQRPQNVLNDESRQFALLVNSVTDYAIYMLDTDGIIRTWNPGGQRIKGYDAAEVIGTNFSRFYLPDEVADGMPARNLRTAATEGRYVAEGWRLRKDGSRFHASVVIDPIWVDGELAGFAKVTRDVTERFEANERLLQTQQSLFQAQKLEAIGKLTLGLAHDFNNLLAIIVNCLDLVAVRVKDPVVSRLVDTALRAAERGALLTRQLLTFGRGQPLAREALELDSVLAGMKSLLERSAGPSVQVTMEIEPGLPTLLLDKSQLESAILNLVCNSRDAMPTGGHVRITAAMQRISDPSLPDATPRSCACVVVTDDGEGIPKDQQARVFEPFFTTKPVGRGSGLGLSQVFGFTTQSGGFPLLTSEPGKGTSITLCFPVSEP